MIFKGVLVVVFSRYDFCCGVIIFGCIFHVFANLMRYCGFNKASVYVCVSGLF